MNGNFSISRRGSRDKVKFALIEERARPEGCSQDQIRAAVDYIVAMINALPPEFNGVAVTANGEASDNHSALHSVVVRGEQLDI